MDSQSQEHQWEQNKDFLLLNTTGSSSQNSFKHGLGKVPKFVIAKDIDNSRFMVHLSWQSGTNYRAFF